MKKIGLDARFILRPMRGIPLYVTRLCEYLPAHNRNYLFYLFINKGYEHNDTPDNYIPRLAELSNRHDNLRIVNHNDDAEIMWEQYHLPRLVNEHKIDILHLPANRNCPFTAVPTVATVHDTMEYTYLIDEKYPITWNKNKSLKMFSYNLRRRAYIIALYKYGIKNASRIITVSNHSAKDLKQHLHIPFNRMRVIYHGVDTEYLNTPSLPLHKRSYTLMLGGDSYQKNPVMAITAWAKVNPDIRRKYPLKIVGFCGSDSSPLLSTLRNLGLDNEVEIRGWVSQEEMFEYFRNSALFLFPSRYEGFGFPLLQAMAIGTPIVSTNRSSIPEVLGSVGLQYDPDGHDEMAAGIERLLSDPHFWQVQSENGMFRAQMFSWNKSVAAHLEVYRELL
jgi:glycosyltransferase involved in cell wall biosynthesis